MEQESGYIHKIIKSNGSQVSHCQRRELQIRRKKTRMRTIALLGTGTTGMNSVL